MLEEIKNIVEKREKDIEKNRKIMLASMGFIKASEKKFFKKFTKDEIGHIFSIMSNMFGEENMETLVDVASREKDIDDLTEEEKVRSAFISLLCLSKIHLERIKKNKDSEANLMCFSAAMLNIRYLITNYEKYIADLMNIIDKKTEKEGK